MAVDVKVCEQCGASIYPEHIGTHKAGIWGGKLFCVHCFTEHQSTQVTIDPDEVGTAPVAEPVAEPQAEQEPDLDDDDDSLDDEPASDEMVTTVAEDEADAKEIRMSGFSKQIITPLGGTGLTGPGTTEHRYVRHLNHDGRGAIRCRVFHAKLNDGALQYMEGQINEWIDQNPEVEIKHVNTNVGVVEGKSQEPHLIITLFY